MSATLVTGGMGFVGHHLVAAAEEQGRRVVSYNRDYSLSASPHVTAVQGELFDIPRLLRAVEENGVDRIIHTAAMSHPELSIDLPLTTFAANVDGTIHLFEAARIAGVRRIVNFSSECAYGHQEGELLPEDIRLRPTTPYGVTKVATELLGDVYNSLYDLDVVSLRISEVYGPGMKMPEVLREMLVAAVRGERFELAEGGDHRFQFIHVSDVVAAAWLAADANQLGRTTYNITGGEQVSLAEAAALVRAAFPGAQLTVGGGYIPNWDRQPPFDLTAAREELGYRPAFDLERGIQDYGAWLAQHEF
jgi:UDP-glucose 4-epimerase